MVERAEDEEKWLAAGIAGLQQNAFYMHRSLVTHYLRLVLRKMEENVPQIRSFLFLSAKRSLIFALFFFLLLRTRTI